MPVPQFLFPQLILLDLAHQHHSLSELEESEELELPLLMSEEYAQASVDPSEAPLASVDPSEAPLASVGLSEDQPVSVDLSEDQSALAAQSASAAQLEE